MSLFNGFDRIGSDQIDMPQKNLQNTRFTNYMLSPFTPSSSTENSHIDFATQNMIISSGTARGRGISGSVIDTDSALMLSKEHERHYEKLQLNERLFKTVPYLGRGSCNPVLESQLLQGDVVSDKKSTSTVMDKSFLGYSMHILDDDMTGKTTNADHLIQEMALKDWMRGGGSARDEAHEKIKR
jgi:hypothetical protein